MNTTFFHEQSLFAAALEIVDAEEREKFLAQSCPDDPKLRARIIQLLATHERADRLFSPKLSAFVKNETELAKISNLLSREPTAAQPIGARIGRYRLLQQLGEGGCGVVYLAEQEEPVRRRVALKVIKSGMDSKSVIARFEAERQALALMEHPNIAKVLDAGATEGHRPFFVMELVQGVKITDYCDEHHLDTPARLKLFIQACHAIQHAHQKGVIHRDIKPSNVLVTTNNNMPMPKVIDFGIAKATEGKLTDNTVFTVIGQFVGTPAYMSPEQAEMRGLDVDTRTDIYSLGVLLYELLTGSTPFDQQELLSSGFDEMRRTLREDDPQRPSMRLTSMTRTDLTTTAQRRHVEPPKLISSVKGDLDWIVMKALEKDRARRYQTANGLALDVERYLNNEPVIACPPSRLYRLRKLVRRNKGVFVSGALVTATLIAGLGISTHLYFREREAVKVQEHLRQDAEQARAESDRARTNEKQLRLRAEVREKVTQARVLVLHGKMKEADDLLGQVPAELFSPSLEATTVFRELGFWNVSQKRWKEAADRYSVLVQVNQVDKADRTDAATRDLLMATPLLIEAGDYVGYDRIRQMELDRLAGTENPIAAEHLVKTSLLLPADPAVMERLTPLGELLAESLNSDDHSSYVAWRPLALALLEYRQDNFAAATDWLEKCAEYPGQQLAYVAATRTLRSMILARLGQREEAAAELKAGKEMIEDQFRKGPKLRDAISGSMEGWLHARILLREAEKLEHNPTKTAP